MNNCIVSGTMEFTGGCDVIDKCKTAFVMSVLDTDCCSGCEPAVCECSPTTVNGLSGAVVLTSPDGSVTIETNGQDIELVVSGLEPLVPDYSTTGRLTGRKWIDGRDVWEVVVSGIPPAPGQGLAFNPDGAYGIQIIKSDFWLTNPANLSLSIPIPYLAASGMEQGWPATNGQWTIRSFMVPGAAILVEASADADDFSDPNDNYMIHGIVEFLRI